MRFSVERDTSPSIMPLGLFLYRFGRSAECAEPFKD